MPTLEETVKALLPKKVCLALAQLQPPDHVVTARQECAYQFLEQILMPHVLSTDSLTLEWLLSEAKAFKTQFQTQHPEDFRDFSLISSIEPKLELLLMSGILDSEIHEFLQRSYNLLQLLMQMYESEMRAF